MKWFVVLCLVVILSVYDNVEGVMTEKQLKAAVKLVRNVCQPKAKATDEDIDKMHSGDFETIDLTAKCYMWCCLNSNKLITKENTFNYDLAVTLANKNLPETLKGPALDVAGKCRDSAKTLDDKCIAAWEISKCMYEASPKEYFLP